MISGRRIYGEVCQDEDPGLCVFGSNIHNTYQSLIRRMIFGQSLPGPLVNTVYENDVGC